jgi:hypothetical protein
MARAESLPDPLPQILTMDAINAGLRAFRERPSSDAEPVELVCEIFFAMLKRCDLTQIDQAPSLSNFPNR